MFGVIFVTELSSTDRDYALIIERYPIVWCCILPTERCLLSYRLELSSVFEMYLVVVEDTYRVRDIFHHREISCCLLLSLGIPIVAISLRLVFHVREISWYLDVSSVVWSLSSSISISPYISVIREYPVTGGYLADWRYLSSSRDILLPQRIFYRLELSSTVEDPITAGRYLRSLRSPRLRLEILFTRCLLSTSRDILPSGVTFCR